MNTFGISLPGFDAEAALYISRWTYRRPPVAGYAASGVMPALQVQGADEFDPAEYCASLGKCCAHRFLDCCIAYRRDCGG